MPPQPHDGLVDMKGLMALLCVKSRSSVYKYVAENPDFPRPCKLSGGTGRLKFKTNEVARFIESLKASDRCPRPISRVPPDKPEVILE